MRALDRVAGLLALAAVAAPAVAWAQAAPVTPPPSAAAASNGISAIALLAVLGGLIAIVAAGVKMYDLKRKREADAEYLQAQGSDALLRESSLFGAPVTPTVHVPFWSGTPATIDVTGEVPTPEVRQIALRIIRAEASRLRSDFVIDDRMRVVARPRRRVA
jgi:hypothetical protein